MSKFRYNVLPKSLPADSFFDMQACPNCLSLDSVFCRFRSLNLKLLHMKSLRQTSLLFAFLLLATSALAQSKVSVLGLTKTRHHDQTAAGTVSLNEYSLSAYIQGTALSGSFPSSSNRFQPSGGGTSPLSYDAGSSAWERQDYFPTLSALDAAFPNAAYSFLVGSSPAVPLNFPANSYPTVPVVTASAGTWNGGKLLITPAQAAAGFSLISNVSNGDGFLTMEVFSNTEDILYEEITINTGAPVIGTVPPGSLDVGAVYEVTTEFDEVVSSPSLSGQSWAAPGASGFALFSSNTFFEMQVLTPLEAWRLQHFGSIGNTGDFSDTGDQDRDRVVNLIEWATGLNPTSSSTLSTPVVVTGATIEFNYPRSVAAFNAGTAYFVEWSDILPSTSWSNTSVTQQVISDNGTIQQVKATLPSGANGKRFVRLRVTSPP
jgi:hypothetical protein